MTVIPFPSGRARNRDKKLYLSRGEVVALHATAQTVSRILVRARQLHLEELAGGCGLSRDFAENGKDVTRCRITASRYGAGRHRLQGGCYRGGDIVRTVKQGYFGCVVASRVTDVAHPPLGTSFSVIEYEVDFQGIRVWYTAADIEPGDAADFVWEGARV